MRKKRASANIQMTVKVDPEVAETVFNIADKHFRGNVSATLREAIRLLVEEYKAR